LEKNKINQRTKRLHLVSRKILGYELIDMAYADVRRNRNNQLALYLERVGE
jgi:hypothetical protein